MCNFLSTLTFFQTGEISFRQEEQDVHVIHKIKRHATLNTTSLYANTLKNLITMIILTRMILPSK